MNQQQILSTVRHTLTFAGGILVAQGKIDEPTWLEISGGIMALAGWLWGYFSKKPTA